MAPRQIPSPHRSLVDTLDLVRDDSDIVATTLDVDKPFAAPPRDDDDSPDPADDGYLPRGALVGRFLVVERLGIGGMGVVYRAYDPELHRQVAIKLLRPALEDGDGRSRLIREAQAMAQVSHPNVAAIHDVGTLEERVYIAMELVEGRTVSAWLARKKRTWQEVVATFIQAGRGLAAAHAEDLVHRDFKPQNVMIDEKGRVRVVDFGLARSSGVRNAGREPDEHAELGPTQPSGSSLDTPLTRDGALVGTPAYMAIEQFNGLPTDARTDQFSYCVALWEGLYGLRPFSGGAIAELIVNVGGGLVRDLPTTDVPRSIERMLRRGLCPQPNDRWPSLGQLVDALERTIAPRRRSAWLPAIAAAGTALAVGLGVAATAEAETCTGAKAALETVWAPARAEQIGRGFEALDTSATSVWDGQRRRIDAYAEVWQTTHRQACEATAITAEQSTEALDLRMACLHQAKRELDATLVVLEAPDAALVDRLNGMVSGLPVLARCSNLDSLRESHVSPPAEIAASVEETYAAVESARALSRAGRFESALEAGEVAFEDAEALGYDPLLAEATLAVAVAHTDLSHFEVAEPMLLDAQRRAVTSGMWRQAVIAIARYVHMVGHELSRPDEALAFAELGRALATRADDPWSELVLRGAITAALTSAERFDEAISSTQETLKMYADHPDIDPVGRARELDNLATILADKGDFEHALEARLEALEIQRQARGADHPDVAQKLSNLGAIYSMMGRNDEAETAYRDALALQERVLPPDDLNTTISRANLGAILASRGKMVQAEEQYREVLAAFEAKLGARHPNVIMTRYGLASVLLDLQKFDEAEALARQALADAREAFGPKHMRVAGAAAALGAVLLHRDELAESESVFRVAVDVHIKTRGPSHPYTLSARLGLSETLARSGRLPDAESTLRAALEDGLAAHGEDILEVARLRERLAELLLEKGLPVEARAQLEPAWPTLSEAGPTTSADAAFALARALWPDEVERARAMKLAKTAQAAFDGLPNEADRAREVSEWIETRAAL